MKLILLLGMVISILLLSEAWGEEERFPFVIPWNDAAPTAVDVSSLNPAPLDESRRISVREGHFYDATGRRVRFVGANLGAGACFPRLEDAAGIAARMHKYGINCVRMHHMDSAWAQPNMFSVTGGSYGKPTAALDPQSLDRFDYLISQFKQHGIYIDLNLHVGRAFTELDNLPDTKQLPEMGKVVGYFEPTMIERQKLYAQQLLTHFNPYTKTRYADEPTIAVIELTNEDSLLDAADSLSSLPPYYRELLTARWNQYLQRSYRTTAALRKAWNAEVTPLGENLLKNARFAAGTTAWNLEQHETARAEMTTESIPPETDGPPGKALHFGQLHLDGVGWHLQVTQGGLTLQDGKHYTFSFLARAETPRSINVSVMLDQAPYSNAGLDVRVALTPRWQRYTYSFIASGTVPQHVRITFGFGDESPDFHVADVSLRSGIGGIELAPHESLEQGTLSLPSLSDNPRGRDFAAFLIQVESDFSQGLRTYLKETLKTKAPIACSQASYGGLGGVWRESRMDWVDMHAYWQHPWFPRRPWDSNDYRIGNTAMVKDASFGTLPGLAMHRVQGKPFTVSEYDHPAPNEYAAEMVPMIFAYAAWQDWDGVFPFAYHGDETGWDRDHIDSFFDQGKHAGKFAFMPAAAQLFLRSNASPAPSAITLVVSKSRLAAAVARRTSYNFWTMVTQGQSVTPPDMIAHQTMVQFTTDERPIRVNASKRAFSKRFSQHAFTPPANTPQLAWTPDTGLFTFDAPTVKIITGFLGGKQADLTGLRLAAEPSARNFLSLALTSLDGQPIAQSRSLLLTLVDKVENPHLEWNADRTFAARSWEGGPEMAEGVTAQVGVQTKAAHASVYALDTTGKRRHQISGELHEGWLHFRTDPTDKTLWYEIVLSP